MLPARTEATVAMLVAELGAGPVGGEHVASL